ncbi:alpha beta superfamily hydrolase protein [Rutstroemia sp. NJR-2017a BVV2]|nr:alpha beta superfamily hydrolase protein [Rutstroemia sp. NJR-2017a BVV2]
MSQIYCDSLVLVLSCFVQHGFLPSRHGVWCRDRRDETLYLDNIRVNVNNELLLISQIFSFLLSISWVWGLVFGPPGLPPNARQETIATYQKECLGIQWREEKIKSTDGTSISLCVAEANAGTKEKTPRKMIYILYFQGNASSLPPRLPFLSSVPRKLQKSGGKLDDPVQYVFVCCSYRGYWTSSGRPSERGIIRDAVATLHWVKEDLQSRANPDGCDVILWGQSIGAGVATSLAAKEDIFSRQLRLQLLILETPFLGIKAMLETLYPQKWLPYRHLWPFLRNHLDSWKALGDLHDRIRRTGMQEPRVFILQAGKDELVPTSHGDMLQKRCAELGLDVKRKIVESALHNEVLVRGGGSAAIAEAIEQVAREDSR